MTEHPNADVGCRLVGEFVDDAEPPRRPTFHDGAVVRPKVVADYLDFGARGDGANESMGAEPVSPAVTATPPMPHDRER
jgi:hypothetical protein